MGEVIQTKYYRLADGQPARLRIEIDDDQQSLNPRINETNNSVMVTWDSDYTTPDQVHDLPDVLRAAASRWSSEPELIFRFARMFTSLPYVAALTRDHNGAIGCDEKPSPGAAYVGIVVVPEGVDDPDNVGIHEVARYSSWATGDVFGYVVEVSAFPGADMDYDAENIDSCWGFIGDGETADLIEQAESNFEDGWKEIDEQAFDDLQNA